MKKAFKAVWHGIKRAYSTVDGWLNKLFEVELRETSENQEEKEAEKQKERAKYFRGLRLVAGTGLTVIVAFWAIVFVIWSVEGVSEWVDDMVETDKEMFEYAYLEETLSDNLFYFGRNYSSRGFLADSNDKIILKDVVWIAKPMEGDSLVCFSDGSNRGYFHIRDGRVVVEPKYSHAWIFSDGLAAVEEKGRLKFINSEGQIVIDQNLTCDFSGSGYVFHNGRQRQHRQLCGAHRPQRQLGDAACLQQHYPAGYLLDGDDGPPASNSLFRYGHDNPDDSCDTPNRRHLYLGHLQRPHPEHLQPAW